MKFLNLPRSLSLLFASLALAVSLPAAENATGTWKWSFATQNGDNLEPVLKLKQDGEKLNGTLEIRGTESKIEDGKVSGEGKVTFKVSRERNGETFVSKYEGKLSGDSIKGKSESNFGGQVREREWDAKREKSGGANLTGKYVSSISLDDGQTFDMDLQLKQDGDKLSGSLSREGGTERKFQDGAVKNEDVNFVFKSERDGRTVTSKYNGKISGDKIKGEVETDWSGEFRKLKWEAKKEK